MDTNVTIRAAREIDALEIASLYHQIYGGTYPDPLMSDLTTLREALRSEDYCWIVAQDGQRLVGSVVLRVDKANLLAKAFGAVVSPDYRGAHMGERLLAHGHERLADRSQPIEVIYATTRTVSAAPQRITASLGYCDLGIFPNVHKTDRYETHCLVAFFRPEAFARRFTDFQLHSQIAPLYEIVRDECNLPALPLVSPPVPEPLPSRERSLDLEVVAAPRFVTFRFEAERVAVPGESWYFPFQAPNTLLTTPNGSIQVYVYLSASDKHCVVLGIKDEDNLGYARILRETCRCLSNLSGRYIEFIIRADDIHKIGVALQSRFIPSAYFPALQLHDGKRYDFVVFSRSFEALNFHYLQLEGIKEKYLLQYYNMWQEFSLRPSLLPGKRTARDD